MKSIGRLENWVTRLNLTEGRPMRYQSTTGLDEDKLADIIDRVTDIFHSRGIDFSRHALNVKEQVIFTLSLLRNNLAQMFIADLSGISQPTASRIYRRMLPVIDQALAFTGISLEEAARDGRTILVDGTYVPTGNRPAQGTEVTTANYSGKRRCQCLSIQVAATITGQLIATSTPVPGARHDSAALVLTGWSTILSSSASPWIADTAYTIHGAYTPIKKTPGHERTDADKQYNKEIASIRSRVEHAIGHLKQWKTIATGYRGRLTELPDIIATITRLELYRLGW